MATLASTSLSDRERATLDRFTERASAALGERLHGIWLYGSRARGEPRKPESDIDILVISRDGHDDWFRLYDLLTEAADDAGASAAFFSLKVHDPGWLADRRAIESFFIQEVDRDKVVLAGAG